MDRLDSLHQYFDPGLTLALPGPDGVERDYVIPLPSAELGLWCRLTAEATGQISAASSDDELREAAERAQVRAQTLPTLPGNLSFEQQLLGAAHGQMLADGVADPYVLFAARTAYVWIVGGEEAATRWWRSGGRPEAPGPVPNRADRRAQIRAGGTSGGAVNATPTLASGSGTNGRRNSGRRRKAGGSRGRTS